MSEGKQMAVSIGPSTLKLLVVDSHLRVAEGQTLGAHDKRTGIRTRYRGAYVLL